MREQFINSKIIGIIYKNLVSKLNLQLNSDEKTKLTKKMINVMNQIYSNIDINRVNSNNFKNILRQFINNCYQTIYADIVKTPIQQKTENFQNQNPYTTMSRDQQISGNRQNMLDPRSKSMTDDKFASFNDSFNINPRQQSNGFQGRYDTSSAIAKKSDFSKSLDDRYNEIQNEYRESFNNGRPSTPPQLRGDGGVNLNKMTKDNIKIKQQFSQPEKQKMSSTQFLKSSDPRDKSSSNSKDNISKDDFNFGTVNDQDNNYDVIDGTSMTDGNMDQWNTGINPSKFNIDENTPLEQKLKQYQMERENVSVSSDKKQVRFNEDKNQIQTQQQYNQSQQQYSSRSNQQSNQYISNEQDEDEERITRMNDMKNNHMIMEANRMMSIPKEQIRVPENEGFSNTVETKLGEYENTIGLLLDKVKDLQQQQIKHMSNNINTETDDKIRLLEAKKGEILGEVTRLQSLTLNLEKQQQVIQEQERRIKQKELDIDIKIRKYDVIKNMDEKQIIIKASSGKFTYSLNDSLKNVSIVQLLNYNIPFDENNININNNKLYFSVISENNKTTRNDSDDDILSSENEDNVEEIYINSTKMSVMTIPEDNYDIYGLLEIMNKIGNKWNIYFSLVKSRVIIKTNKTSRLKLYLDRDYQNNVLPYLGFAKIIGDKYKHSAEKKYNIKNEKMIQLYLKNICVEPFAEFMIGSEKIHKFTKEVNIGLLNKLEIEMKVNDKLYVPDEPYILEFNLIMNKDSKDGRIIDSAQEGRISGDTFKDSFKDTFKDSFKDSLPTLNTTLNTTLKNSIPTLNTTLNTTLKNSIPTLNTTLNTTLNNNEVNTDDGDLLDKVSSMINM